MTRFEKEVRRIANYVLRSSGGGSSYLVYTALLTQSGTDAPVATVLENTLGGTVFWTRTQAGVYKGTLAGAFTVGRTFIPLGNDWAGDGFFWIPVSQGGEAPIGWMSITISNANEILVQFADNPPTGNVDWSTIATTSNFPVQVFVYPE